MVKEMKAIKRTLMLTILMIVALMGSVCAAPIVINDLQVQEDNGEYTVLVTLDNTGVTSHQIYSDLSFTIEELGTTKSIGVVTVENDTKKVFTYNLDETTDDFDSLKKGETYTIKAATADDSMSRSFLFGKASDDSGLGLVIEEIEVDGIEVTNSEELSVLNGQDLRVDFKFTALENFDDARLMVFIEGYEHSPLSGSTEIFSVKDGKTYVKSLDVTLPADMDNQKDYKLRIMGANDLSGLTYKDYTLYVDTQRHRVDILDVVMTPSSGVEPGQNMIANVRLKNRGQKSEESVKVIVAIPELNINEASYVSNLDSDETITSDDMLLFVPEDAVSGDYDVQVTLAYNDGYTTTQELFKLSVLSPTVTAEKNLLVSFDKTQDLVAGKENTFEVVIANPNSESKPISIATIDNAWADVEVTPSLAMVQAGASETFTVKVTPKSAVAGEKELALIVKEGSKSISEITVETYVEGGSSISWVHIALGVLIIIGIIVLISLFVAVLGRRKDDHDDDMSSTEEYY